MFGSGFSIGGHILAFQERTKSTILNINAKIIILSDTIISLEQNENMCLYDSIERKCNCKVQYYLSEDDIFSDLQQTKFKQSQLISLKNKVDLGLLLRLEILMQSLDEKQKYLRQHIDPELYEQFFQYIQETVSNIDLETWSPEFLITIVQTFKENHNSLNNAHQTSFYQYQQQPREEQKSIKSEKRLKDIKTKPQPVTQPIPITKYQQSNNQANSTPALHLFDSIFDPNAATTTTNSNTNVQSKPIAKRQPPTQKALPTLSEIPFKTVDATYFDNRQFWDLKLKDNNVNATKPKSVQSTADFATFDFWSQPSSVNSSPQDYKAANRPTATFKTPETTNDKKNQAVPSFQQLLLMRQKQEKQEKQQKLLSFQQLLAMRQKQEKQDKHQKHEKPNTTSPYQKKNYVEQKSAATKQSKVIYDGEIVVKTEFKDSVKCFPSAERKQFNHPNLSVTIQNHEIISRTFLMPDYVMYSVKVHPLNIICKRNYEDFTRLRSTLSQLYPGIKLSYLEKNSWFYSTNIEFIKKQKTMLQLFLNDLIKNKEILNSRIIEDFLTLTEHKKIKRKFEQYEKLEKPKAIEQLCLMQGRVQVDLSQNQRLYQQNLRKYHEKMLILLEKHQRLSETLSEQYREIKTTLQSITQLANSIIEETHYFNQRVYGMELGQVEDIFKIIKSCYAHQTKKIDYNLDFIATNIQPFLNYEKDNLHQFTDLINIQQTFFRSYLKRSQFEKAENIPYTSDKIKNMKIGILTESKNILVLKYQAGYLSNQVCKQAKRIFETLGKKYRAVWRDYSLKQKEQHVKDLEFWTNICASC